MMVIAKKSKGLALFISKLLSGKESYADMVQEDQKKGKKKIELQFRRGSKEKRCFEQFRHFPKIFPKMFAVFP